MTHAQETSASFWYKIRESVSLL